MLLHPLCAGTELESNPYCRASSGRESKWGSSVSGDLAAVGGELVMEEEDYKLVTDNVHGYIKIFPLPYLIINTSIFKRLKVSYWQYADVPVYITFY